MQGALKSFSPKLLPMLKSVFKGEKGEPVKRGESVLPNKLANKCMYRKSIHSSSPVCLESCEHLMKLGCHALLTLRPPEKAIKTRPNGLDLVGLQPKL